MKLIHFAHTATLGLTLAGLTACSDDPAPALQPTLPTSGGDPVKEIVHNGNLPDCCDWKLTYGGGRLTSATGTWHRLSIWDMARRAYR